jgi:hypothetical protein
MNAITEISPLAAEPPQSGAPAETFVLRRTGKKPMRIEGWLLVDAASTAEPGLVRYDLRLYRTLRGQIVIELVVHREALGAADIELAESQPDLGAASAWLEAYDSASDLPVPPSLTDKDKPLAAAALQAVALRQQAARVRDEFACLLSDVFAALGIAETLEPVDGD